MKIFLRYFSALILFALSTPILAQNSAEIVHELERLKSPYRALYLAAHPDDENTRLISYLTRDEKVRTAYLSLTRGDGGQNLIGDEKGPLLGVLRTEELLAARSIDGGEQYFSRAVDFGYSKTSKESFEYWEKDVVFSDVLYVIRYYKPHVVINRFPTDNYNGHGHHHASALLSNEAFDKSADETFYPEQVKEFGAWKIGTLYFNSSSWWDKNLPERAKNDISIKEVNVGSYNKLLGYSYNEESAFSRSQHKSQGFGSAPTVGDQFEYLEYLKGDFQAENLFHEGLLDSIDKRWLSVGPIIDSIINAFNYRNPSSSIASLLYLRNQALTLDTLTGRFDKKIEELNSIIFSCMGFSAELISENDVVNKDQTIVLDLQAINRSAISANLLELNLNNSVYSWNRPLDENILFKDTVVISLTDSSDFTSPYWLNEPFGHHYHYDQSYLKTGGNEGMKGELSISINDEILSTKIPVVYKWTDRVKGGLKKDLAVLPKATLSFDQPIYLPKNGKIDGHVIIQSQSDQDISGEITIVGDKDLSIVLESAIEVKAKGMTSVPFSISIPDSLTIDPKLKLEFATEGNKMNESLFNIDYDHIRPQRVLLSATAKIVPVELKEEIGKIAYVAGPDNEMIEYLKQGGCDITEVGEDIMLNGGLDEYDVLLFGIRSINVNPDWNKYEERVHEFIKNGGLVVMQYQTSRGINPIKLSPYSFEISRKRVTDETATTNISRKEHRLFNAPFKLERSDFDNWNQERGLYFADSWDEKFTTVISWHDEEELDEFGSLIVGDFGKGAFIYTGISFFRHIPYGVPGSYKLFYNILSYKSK